MYLRTLFATAGGMAVLLTAGLATSSSAQAPFTIRYPLDGATVRERVPIRVPLASIPEGGYVTITIDGQFREALAPTPEQRKNHKRGAAFEYQWDTKAAVQASPGAKVEPTADGIHEVSASLYIPKGGTTGGATRKQTSSVRVTVNNKVPDPGPIWLRYRFIDGSERTYGRSGQTLLVAGLSQGLGASGDQELVGQQSDILFSVEDIYPGGDAIVRNKLTRLSVRQSGQDSEVPESSLPRSLYQQVDKQGHVHYQNASQLTSEFAMLGMPVNATLEIPILHSAPVRVGDTWQTHGVSLEIPGTAPADQPKVTVTSKLDGFEWEGGYPTAKIVETYDSAKQPLKATEIMFGQILLTSPQVKFTREVYIAFKSGTLVKVVRNLEVTGKSDQLGATALPGMGGGSLGSSGMTAPGMSPGMSGMTAPGMSPGMSGMAPGMVGSRGGTTMPGAGMSPGMSGMAPGMRGSSRSRRSSGGMSRGMMGSGMMGSGMMGSSGMMAPGMSGSRMGRSRMYSGFTSGTVGPTQVTLKSIITTEMKHGATQVAAR